MVIEWTRSHILIEVDEKFVTVYGEGLNPEYDGFCYVVFLKSIKKYNKPFENEMIDENDKNRIVSIIKDYAVKNKMKIDFE